MSGYAKQHSALRARFISQWGQTTPVAFPNVAFAPTGGSWVRLVIQDATALNAEIGSRGRNLVKHVGNVIVMIFTLKDLGDNAGLVLADKVMDIFRGWQDIESGIRFYEAPYMRTVGIEDKWHHINVFCPFERHGFK